MINKRFYSLREAIFSTDERREMSDRIIGLILKTCSALDIMSKSNDMITVVFKERTKV